MYTCRLRDANRNQKPAVGRNGSRPQRRTLRCWRWCGWHLRMRRGPASRLGTPPPPLRDLVPTRKTNSVATAAATHRNKAKERWVRAKTIRKTRTTPYTQKSDPQQRRSGLVFLSVPLQRRGGSSRVRSAGITSRHHSHDITTTSQSHLEVCLDDDVNARVVPLLAALHNHTKHTTIDVHRQ